MPCALMGGGNHQVLAAKKYAMTAVSIQTTGASSIDSALLWFPLLHLKVEQKLSHSMKDVQVRLGFRGPFARYRKSRRRRHMASTGVPSPGGSASGRPASRSRA